MKIFLMRHGDSGLRPEDGVGDDWRSLTDEGCACVRAIAREMLVQGKTPKFIMTSAFERARCTGRIVGDIVGAGAESFDDLSPNLSLTEFVASILTNENAKRAMLVGHADNLDPLIEEITGKADPMLMGEVRLFKVDRGTGRGEETWRLEPSDVGFPDKFDGT